MSDWVDALEVDGRRRSYACHLAPGSPTGPRPVLIVLHGRRITGLEMRRWPHFAEAADRRGFIVIYPEGYQRSWNDGRGNTPAGLPLRV